MSTAKDMANAALVYLDFDGMYENGASADSRQFGFDFATQCVEQISNKIDNMKNVTVEALNNEFKKLLKVTQGLNDSELAFGIDLFKSTLITKSDKQIVIEEFLSKDNINGITNEFYNGIMADQKYRDQIAKNLTQSIETKADIAISSNNQKSVEEELNSIPLKTILEYVGAYEKEPDLWTINATGHNVSIKNQVWKNFHTESVGVGGISLLTDYVIEANDLKITSEEDKRKVRINVIEELLAEFGHDLHLNREQDKVAQAQVDKEENSNARFKM